MFAPTRNQTPSALFVDFDNVFNCLLRKEKTLADTFATAPARWMAELQANMGKASAERAILARYCYLNPYGPGAKYRHSFLSAGFRIVDCVPVTRQGKNSADIRLVIDAISLLSHPTPFAEFVVMSADADFLPLLVHLREHGRQTTIVFAGHSSSAYKGTADLAFDEARLAAILNASLSDRPVAA